MAITPLRNIIYNATSEMEKNKRYLIFVDGKTVTDREQYLYGKQTIKGKTNYFPFAEAYICEDNDKWSLHHSYIPIDEHLFNIVDAMLIENNDIDGIVLVDAVLKGSNRLDGIFYYSLGSMDGLNLKWMGVRFDRDRFAKNVASSVTVITEDEYNSAIASQVGVL